MLNILLEQFQNKLVVFFDNLESLQNPESLHIEDAVVLDWINAATELSVHGLKLLLTSRWQWPHAKNLFHFPLPKALYGDFLRFAQEKRIGIKR